MDPKQKETIVLPSLCKKKKSLFANCHKNLMENSRILFKVRRSKYFV